MEGVTKVFPPRHGGEAVTAVENLSLRIDEGSALGIIGPNGAGKTTVLRLIAGVTAPTEGRVTRPAATVAVIELGAGAHPGLSGRENLRLLAELARPDHPPDAAVLGAAAEFSGLGGDLDRPVREYSSGMVARLAFSAAVHSEPDLLLVDEVLSVGDLEFQDQSRRRINRLREDGTTVVIVSHDLGLIEQVCPRSVLLLDGVLDRAGPTGDIVRHYLGRPRTDTSAGGMALASDRVQGGDDLHVQLGPALTGHSGRLRFELSAPLPAGLGDGTDNLVVVGHNQRDQAGEADWRISTRGIPAGEFFLIVTAERSDGTRVASGQARFTVVGPPGPNAFRLSARVAVDGITPGST